MKPTPPRIWKFALFAAIQGFVCLLLCVLLALLQILAESAAGKTNEFVGMYLVVALWVAPFFWLVATPSHLYFYLRRPAPTRHVLSFLVSACVVLAGSALMSRGI